MNSEETALKENWSLKDGKGGGERDGRIMDVKRGMESGLIQSKGTTFTITRAFTHKAMRNQKLLP